MSSNLISESTISSEVSILSVGISSIVFSVTTGVSCSTSSPVSDRVLRVSKSVNVSVFSFRELIFNSSIFVFVSSSVSRFTRGGGVSSSALSIIVSSVGSTGFSL